jgi:hypothetical protein
MIKYTYRHVCPRNKKYLTNDDVAYNGGVCIHCGHDNNSTFGHYENEIGYWVREGFFGNKWLKKES